MGHQRVRGGLPYEMQIEIQAHHAAQITDRPELVVRQVAAMRTDAPRVGMGRDDGPPRHTDKIPEARVGQMGYVGIDVVLLQRADEVSSLRGQAPLRLLGIGTGQHVGPVPHRVQKAHAPTGHRFDLMYVAVNEVGALDAQQRGHHAL